MKLVVGLGNPGKQYAKTRHNIGFMVLDTLHDGPWELSKKFNGEISTQTINEQKILLVKPMTFMNDSGQAVALIAHFYKLHPSDIIVVHDDKDLPLGEIRVQTDRGHAGHNGVRSIIECLGSKAFTRIRMGIASTEKKKMDDTAAFVLSKFSLIEKRAVKTMIDRAITEITQLIKGGYDQRRSS